MSFRKKCRTESKEFRGFGNPRCFSDCGTGSGGCVFVSLHQSEDIYSDKFFSPLAKCTYVPDGKDIGGEGELTWDVRAAHEKVPLNIIDMACLWRQERHKFIAPREMEINGKTIVDNEYLDEDALVAHLSAMTNVPEDKVTINHFKAFVTEYFKQ